MVVAALALGGCTHVGQTSADGLPDRVETPEFSFDRPQGDGWYRIDTLQPPAVIQFTQRTKGRETKIEIVSVAMSEPVRSLDDLTVWAQDLPEQDPIVRADSSHGALCVRHRGRSSATVHYVDDATKTDYQYRIIADEDSLECVDPVSPTRILRFVFSQRSQSGGSAEGEREADAFLSSVQFNVAKN